MRREQRQGLHHRVAGTQRLALDDPRDAAIRHAVPHLLRSVADHHAQALGLEPPRRVQDMGQQRPARERMQHLGNVGMHPLALAGGEDDNLQWGSSRLHGVLEGQTKRAGSDPCPHVLRL